MIQNPEIVDRRYLGFFILAGLFNNILEGIKMHTNSEIIANTKDFPYVQLFQYGLLWNNMFTVFCAFLSIVFVDIGYAFVFYVFLFESIWRKIYQLHYFKFGPIYILQFFLSIIFGIIFGIKSVNLYHRAIFLNFRFIGANNKLIIAFIIRRICNSIKNVFYIDIIFSFFLVVDPSYVPSTLKTVPKYVTLNIILIFLLDREDNDENLCRKVFSIILWLVLDLQFILEKFTGWFFSTDSFLNPRHITLIIIISMYIGFKVFDLYLNGSGLREFLKEKHFNDQVRLN